MMAPSGEDAIEFGPFQLVPNERRLLKDNVPILLGTRAFDILIILASQPNKVVSKQELLSKVWPNLTVEEGALRVHIAALRKALGDNQDGVKYITTSTGQGYCFVATTSQSHRFPSDSALSWMSRRPSLPSPISRIIGRVASIEKISTLLVESRLVTIAGAGGVGKTTVAIAVARNLADSFSGEVVFVDLGAVETANMVHSALASTVGLAVAVSDVLPSLVAFFRAKRIFLVLDNCEHVIESVATLVEELLLATPQTRILTTSRENLRVEGERVYRLQPLAFPPDDPSLTANAVLSFPAARLFADRVLGAKSDLSFNNTDAAIIAVICRKLDGIPLAIELAAACVEIYGLGETLTLLGQRLNVLRRGRRNAPPRQRTLQATLDWSYATLSRNGQLVLNRLAVFIGTFSLEDASAIAADEEIDQTTLIVAIDDLVTKSMLATETDGATMRYRLLETTRVYALELIGNDDEATAIRNRHARHFRSWLEQTGEKWPTLSRDQQASYVSRLGNVRAALHWCFGAEGNSDVGIPLAAAAAPIYLAMSLLIECQQWSRKAISALDEASLDTLAEMRLQTALGISLIFTQGNGKAAVDALNRALEIAVRLNDVENQIELIGRLHMLYHRAGDQRLGLQYAKRGFEAAQLTAGPAAIALGNSLMGISLGYTGELEDARRSLEASLRNDPGPRENNTIFQGISHYNIAGAYLGRTLWLQGFPDRAIHRVRANVDDATVMGHPVTLCIALGGAAMVLLWAGDLVAAEENINRLITYAEAHSMTPHVVVGRGMQADLMIQRGMAESGVAVLKRCVNDLRKMSYNLFCLLFNLAIARGLRAMDRSDEAVILINDAIKEAEVTGELSYMPEFLRIKSNCLIAKTIPDAIQAEACLNQSLEWSRRQSAMSWELRAASDLAEMHIASGREAEGRSMLKQVFDKFSEGFQTGDLRAAKSMLDMPQNDL